MKRAAMLWAPLVVVVLMLVGGSSTVVAIRPTPPDVVLIVLDALRRDHMSLYHYERRTTPVLDARTARMRVFTEAITAAPQTAPSMASVFTGQPPRVHGLQFERYSQTFSTGRTPLLSPLWPTLAERFKAAGYATLAVTTNPWIGADWGFARGFDTFVGWKEVDPVLPMDGRRVLKHVSTWLDGAPRQPRFIYAHFMDVHAPYDKGHQDYVHEARTEVVVNGPHVVAPADLAYLEDLYDSDIRYADALLGQLFARLDATGRPWVAVVMGDHGDEFGEHGGTGHGTTLYDELVRIPVIVTGRGTVDRAGESRYPLQATDLTELLLAEGGIAPSPLLGLVSTAAREPAADDMRIMTSELSGMGALRQGHWKYIVNHEPFSELLFDLATDPGEHVNVARECRPQAEQFRRRARELWPDIFAGARAHVE